MIYIFDRILKYPQLIITVPPKISPFTFGDEAVSYGELVSIQCNIGGGDLPVNVEWTLNGSPITSDLDITSTKQGHRVNNLLIESVAAKHAGNYTCIARNYAGITEFSSVLIVNGLWKIFFS